ASRRFAAEHIAIARAALTSLPGEHGFLDALVETMAARPK
ncbi:MAG: polyprenyl synthetase family protein, partial [Opitutaceae bacterium]|nr:polyprenyl synthetase family protein [Opitutaceae bacterium]